MIRTLVLLALAWAAATPQAEQPKVVMPNGRFCGVVATYRYDTPVKCDVVLSVLAADSTTYHVYVPQALRPMLSARVEDLFQQDVCVSGPLLMKDREPHFTITTPSQIEVTQRHEVAPFAVGAASDCDADVTAPLLVHEVKPTYTGDAMRAGAQGTVRLAAVVGADGSVTDVRLLEGVHAHLDAEAISTVRQWRFRPGRRAGAVVPVMVTIDVGFALGPRK